MQAKQKNFYAMVSNMLQKCYSRWKLVRYVLYKFQQFQQVWSVKI